MNKAELARMIDLSCVQASSTLEELREAVEPAGEGLVADFELVVGVVAGGVGVVVAAVLAHEISVVGDVRIFFGAEEEHVLEKMREALGVGGVVDLADVHDEGGAGFVELRVGDEENAQAVIEGETAELRGIGGRDDARREGGHGGFGSGEWSGEQRGGEGEKRRGEAEEFHAGVERRTRNVA